MQLTDITGVLVWAFIAGGFAFVVLIHSLKSVRKVIITRWCLLTGFAGLGLFSLLIILNFRPSAKAVTLIFIALPVFVCGLLLFLHDKFLKAKNEKN